ncbi:MAG: hypothetical protein ACLQKA_14720 [Bryobacteraceae bacterium]
MFAASSTAGAWYPSSGNHLLNTLLERLSWNIFGFNQVALRLPALLGGAIYLLAAARICSKLPGAAFHTLLFLCLALNPLVLDYLVAARGYSLAVGFLLASVAVFWELVEERTAARPAPLLLCAIASMLLALSFSANFSFALVDGLTALVFLATLAACRELGGLEENGDSWPRRVARLAVSITLPGACLAFLICGSVLVHWPHGQIIYGAESLREMWKSLYTTSFPAPNPEIVNPMLYPAWAMVGHPLCVGGIVLLCVQVSLLFLPGLRKAVQFRYRAIPAALATIVVAAVVLHWVARRAFGVLLPQARTALFFAPLLTLLLASSTAILRRSKSHRALGIPGAAFLGVASLYFFGCLRLHYFQEWRFNEDTKGVYWVMRDAEQRCGVHEFATEWRYAPVLNFYRKQYGDVTMKPFTASFNGSFPIGKDAYVL